MMRRVKKQIGLRTPDLFCIKFTTLIDTHQLLYYKYYPEGWVGYGRGAISSYKRIAIDIASQIADGEIGEGERVSGRSLLASEYGVSPETIRRSLRLLADMKVVEIEDKKGVTILSADNAKRYISDFKDRNEQHDLHLRLKELFDKYVDISRQIWMSLCLNNNPYAADKESPRE